MFSLSNSTFLPARNATAPRSTASEIGPAFRKLPGDGSPPWNARSHGLLRSPGPLSPRLARCGEGSSSPRGSLLFLVLLFAGGRRGRHHHLVAGEAPPLPNGPGDMPPPPGAEQVGPAETADHDEADGGVMA